MNTDHRPPQQCTRCGAVLTDETPLRVCAACALAGVLDSPPAEKDAEILRRENVPAPGARPSVLRGSVSEKPGDRIGRYKLLQQIGEGGCGLVYLAEQEQPVRRRVALKVIKAGMDTRQVLARFEAERQALALMDHPNIARVLDAGATENGRPFFVMDLVKGIPITRYCDENRLDTQQRLALFIQVCQAVQHAHQKGIIHRDIKPSNILVADHDGVPVPKVIDFGLAKATNDQQLTDKTLFTAFEQFIGTPAYMSPEQARLSGLDIDTRTDIYSLGVLLYELLTGKTPFESQQLVKAGLDEIRRIIREDEPPRPSTRLSTLDAEEQTQVARCRQSEPPKLIHLVRGDLDWIVMRCLEKERTRRYEAANSLADDVQRHLKSEPVAARPPSNLYRFQKLVQRHTWTIAASGAVALALATGLGIAIWMFFKEAEARQQATRAMSKEVAARSEAEGQRKRALEQEALARSQGVLAIQERDKAVAERAKVDELVRHMLLSRIDSGSNQNDTNLLRGLTFDLTRDDRIQEILADELEEACRKMNPKSALGIVVNPNSGDVLALANRPASDFNDINPTLGEAIEPGSTFQFLIAATALNERIVDLDTMIDCENGVFFYAGRTLRDHNDFGRLSVRDILAKQSRIGFVKLALKVGDVKLHQYVQRFGFGHLTGIHLPGESQGSVNSVSNWGRMGNPQISMGHGVTVTPLQLVMGMSVIANGGKLMAPRVVKSVKDHNGREIVAYAPETLREVISSDAATAIRSALGAVATDEGTAARAAVKGFTVGGVCGTTQKVIDGGYSHERIRCSFVGFLPVDNPQFVCLILIDEAQLKGGSNTGGYVAAPVFSRVSERIALHLGLENSSRTK